MVVEFNEQAHIYMVNGEVANTSVTKLLAKHHLANDYTGIDEKILKNKANYGKKIHKDIERLITEKDYTPETEAGIKYNEYIKENIDSAIAEQLLGLDYNGLTIGGSCDLMAFNKLGETIIADHKTYANMTNETKHHIAWQLSLYDYMARKIKEINGKKFKWKGAKHFYINWFKKNGDFELIEVDKIDDTEIEELLNCEIKGEIYKPRQLIVANDLVVKLVSTELEMAEIEFRAELLKKQQDEYRTRIKEIMEEQNIMNWSSPNGLVKVSYTPTYNKQQLDTKRIKEELPDVYTKYVKQTPVKSSIRITTDYEKYLELKESVNGESDILYMEHKE